MSTTWGDAVVTFKDVSFGYGHNKPIVRDTSFSIRRGAKLTLMGQNGAGKSSLFNLITGVYEPEEGAISINPRVSIAIARQVIPREQLDCTVREFFQACFSQKVYDIDPKIDAVLEVVHLHAPHDRIIKSFSGGQQARLLLASALIQEPDLLLLDEPTNNLDVAGVEHLTDFLKAYTKTCVVISHDAGFLNAFTQGVLYLDARTKHVEQYVGNYSDVVEQISQRVEKEERHNAQMEKKIQEKKDKANFFAHKGGNLRLVAKRMRAAADEAEESMVEVRQEDKTIRRFTIPVTADFVGPVLTLSSVTIMKDHKPREKKVDVELRKGRHLLLKGPNGIGKTTLLEKLATGHAHGELVHPDAIIGYYRQDFSNLDFNETPYQVLDRAMKDKSEQRLRSVAAGFLLDNEILKTKIGSLSEGQKGLVAFARLVLLQPGLLILDEPTNHINFRHIPVIAQALHDYQGALILVSHVPSFVEQVHIDEVLDLGK